MKNKTKLTLLILAGSLSLFSPLCSKASDIKVPFPVSKILKVKGYIPAVETKPVIVIDKTGKQLNLPKNVIYFGRFSEGLISVLKTTSRGRKCGFADENGNIVIEPIYDRVHEFHDGVAVVEEQYDPEYGSGLFSIIDRTGKVVKKFSRAEANSVTDFKDGYASIRRFNSKKQLKQSYEIRVISAMFEERCDYGFIDRKGETIVEPKFEKVLPFSQGLAAARKNDKWGFINDKGDYVIDPKYKSVRSFSEDMAAVRIDNKTGFTDKSGKEIIAPQFDDAGDFQSGLAPVKVGSLWGFIDKSGQMKIQPKFFLVADGFKNNVAACAINTLPYQQNDKTNSMSFKAVSPVFYRRETVNQYKPLTLADYFLPQLKYGLINENGDFLKPPEFDKIYKESDGLRLVKKKNKFGFIDSSANTVVEPMYTDAQSFSQGKALVSEGKLPGNSALTVNTDWTVSSSSNKLKKFTPWPCYDPEIFEKNLEVCNEVARLEPDESIIYDDIAWFNYALNRKEKALEAYSKAIELNPEDSELLSDRAQLYLAQSDWKNAEKDLNEYFKKYQKNNSPNFPKREWMLRSIARVGLGDLEGAQSDLLDRACMGEFEKRKLRGDANTSINDSPALLRLFEALKDYDTAEIIWFNCFDDENRVPPFLQYPKTLPELEKDLDAFLKEADSIPQKSHPYLSRRKNYLAAETLQQIIDAKVARYETSDLESLLKQLIDLRSKENYPVSLFKLSLDWQAQRAQSAKTRIRFQWGNAKYQLMKFYAEALDQRCEAIYNELMKNDIDKLNWRMSASAVYGNYLARTGKSDKAEKVFKFGMEKYANNRIARAYSKFLRSQNKIKEADKLLADRLKEERQFGNHGTLAPAPVPGEKTTAADFIELAKMSEQLGLINTVQYYLDKADTASPSEKEKKYIQDFRAFRLPPKRVSTNVLAYFQQCLNSEWEYSREYEIDICKDCIDKEPQFLAPYVRVSQIFIEEGKFDEAQKFLDKALQINSKYEDALIMKGRLFADQNKNQEAQKIFEEALIVNPNNQTVSRELSLVKKHL